MQAPSFRIRLAALQELAALGIAIKLSSGKAKRSPKMKRSATATFGVALDVLVERDGVIEGDVVVPKILSQIGRLVRRDIHTDGLFRVCGSAARMRKAQASIDGGADVEGSVHDVAGLLKQFLRDLPEPLLTYALYPCFVRAQLLPDAKQRRAAILHLCLALPDAHLHALRFLMRLLHEVVHAPCSRMTPSNLAAIFAPNVLKPEEEQSAAVSGEVELSNHAACVLVVEALIENCEDIGVPGDAVVKRAEGLGSEEKAQHDYLAIVEGQRTWWRNPFARKQPKISHLTSAATLDLLKRPLAESNSGSSVSSLAASEHRPSGQEQAAEMTGFDSFMMY